MGWRDTLHPHEVTDLQALEEKLREGYDEDLFYERQLIINRAHARQTELNREKRNG